MVSASSEMIFTVFVGLGEDSRVFRVNANLGVKYRDLVAGLVYEQSPCESKLLLSSKMP